MSVIAVIQARLSSRRLPGKVLMPLGGRPVLAWVTRAAQAIDGVQRSIVVTSREPSDDAIAAWCAAEGQECFRGALDDVLSRYVAVAERYRPEAIMRITADCPLLDPEICAQVLRLFTNSGCDYAVNWIPRSWPVGLDCEVIRTTALLRAHPLVTTAYEREHVTPYIETHPEQFSRQNYLCPLPGLGDERWVLDTAEDYARLSIIAERLGNTMPSFARVLAMTQGRDTV